MPDNSKRRDLSDLPEDIKDNETSMGWLVGFGVVILVVALYSLATYADPAADVSPELVEAKIETVEEPVEISGPALAKACLFGDREVVEQYYELANAASIAHHDAVIAQNQANFDRQVEERVAELDAREAQLIQDAVVADGHMRDADSMRTATRAVAVDLLEAARRAIEHLQ